MLTLLGPRLPGTNCAGSSRRDFLRIGTLGVGGLALSDLLRWKAQGAVSPTSPESAVIMVYLPGGPSHIDMYDMKPDAPVEYRGEFRPIRTNVPGIDICELMPRQAALADKFSVVRGLRTHGNHDPTELLTGIHAEASGTIGRFRRPAIGCVVSRVRGVDQPIPPYVSTSSHKLLGSYDDPEEPAYLGPAHRAFSVVGPIMQSMGRLPGVSMERLGDRRSLLGAFDSLRRRLDSPETPSGSDNPQRRALDMITSTRVRDALDLNQEPERVREHYGNAGTDFLRARRLIEAGVSFVSVASRFYVNIGGGINDPGGWDTHAANFRLLRAKLPIYDQAVAALISDLHDRGLNRHVTVVIWGEFGRTPRIGDVTPDGRGHWPSTGFAFVSGNGLRMGQIVGASDRRGEYPVGRPFSSQDVLATIYHALGIDLATTFPDHSGRPQYLLDRATPIGQLI